MTKREETKAAKVQAMLRRPSGASLQAICTATGWQPHSARSALSTMRKKGLPIERRLAGKAGAPAIYHMPSGAGDE
ncbi:DUF3489 domain-containing protein [Sedimentitalea nanhaiensis]|uniref:DUF3489 domain-containing protein n=1 Tax=Sedimentitalea nanhaiensis TaxID=999627 RepID=A0A1I6YLT2_9RHOB|nr:DUF3489 domain-containing protein [Sedimentitalea nanhaiensis]SFT51459.1 Protein of unknown function [Sedimentitalea nanhaiensis]